MNDLATQAKQLPDNLADLAKFALIGREKLVAVRAEIRAIDKVGLAREVHDQKLEEAQEISEAVLDAEMRMGELLKNMEKAKPSGANQYKEASRRDEASKPKTLKEMGISYDQSSQYQLMANDPETVKRVQEQAREKGEIASRSDVVREIVRKKKKDNPVNRAKERHEEIQSKPVVTMTELKQDKEDVEFIQSEETYRTYRTLSQMCDLIFNLAEFDFDKVEAMSKKLDIEEKATLENALTTAHRNLLKIIKEITEG